MDNMRENKTILMVIEEADERSPSSSAFHSMMFLTFCAMIAGFIGNWFLMNQMIMWTRFRDHPITAFFINLGISNFIFLTFVLPTMAGEYSFEVRKDLSDSMCKTYIFFYYGDVVSSLLSMVAIAINRYVLILKPDIYPRLCTARKTSYILMAIWIYSFSLLIPPLLGILGTIGRDPKTLRCAIRETNGKSPQTFITVVGFILPCIVIIVSYLCIYWKIRKSRQNPEANSNERSYGDFQTSEHLHDTNMMLCMFLLFSLSFIPLTLLNLFDEKFHLQRLHGFGLICSWLFSIINPCICRSISFYQDAD